MVANIGAIRRALSGAEEGGEVDQSQLVRVKTSGLQASDTPDWDGAIAAVDAALERVDSLGRAEFDRPGDRQHVAELLGGVRSALVGAAGAMREAHGASAAVDARRRAITGGAA